MALDTYAALQTSIAAWLNRTDLTGAIPDFIALAEAQIKRRLRNWTVRDPAFSITAESTPLPADCAELRSIRLVTALVHGDVGVQITTLEGLADRRAARHALTGRPVAAAVVGTTLVVAPAPDMPYTADITYYSALVPLSAANTTNTVLTQAPDLYLFGALKEAEPYMENDARVPLWTQKFEAALAELDVQRERQEFGASFRPVRLPVAF